MDLFFFFFSNEHVFLYSNDVLRVFDSFSRDKRAVILLHSFSLTSVPLFTVELNSTNVTSILYIYNITIQSVKTRVTRVRVTRERIYFQF